jgi:hypothetical protein
MERQLNRELGPNGPRIEVINFGVAGYGLPQDYLVIRDKIWRYNPQIVILEGTLHSIVLETTRALAQARAFSGPVPYFVPVDGHLVLDQQTLEERRSFVSQGRLSLFLEDAANKSRVLSLVNNARRAAGSLLTGPWHFPWRRDNSKVSSPDFENLVLRGPVTPELTSAWQIADGLLEMCQAEANRRGAEFWFFLFDMAPQVDPDPRMRAEEQREYGIDDLFGADRLFDEFSTRQGIKHEMLAGDLFAYSSASGLLLHGFPGRPRNSGHWNVAGNRIAGHLLADKLFNCSAVIAGAIHGDPIRPSCADALKIPNVAEEALAR